MLFSEIPVAERARDDLEGFGDERPGPREEGGRMPTVGCRAPFDLKAAEDPGMGEPAPLARRGTVGRLAVRPRIHSKRTVVVAA